MSVLNAPRNQDLSSIVDYTLSTFFPGYAHIWKRFPKLFTLASLVLAIYYIIPFDFLRRQWDRVTSLFVSAVSVETGDDLFDPVSEWLMQKGYTLRANNHLVAKANGPKPLLRSGPNHDPDPEEIGDRKKRSHQPKVLYEHAEGLQVFFHDRTLFWSIRHRNGYGGEIFSNGQYIKPQTITIHTLGRSTAAIKQLMDECFTAKWKSEHQNTIVRRPVRIRYSDIMQWNRIASKTHRSLDTVFLRDDQSMQIVEDVKDFLDPGTNDFYTKRGIPHRRGYLLYGAPGCGKTSFTLALAAKFNLDVYIMTLLNRDLDDTTLTTLINTLSTPSILLLEDIDQAGLGRKPKRSKKHRRHGQDDPAFDIARDFESEDESDSGRDRHRTGVTLSGLLNALDGVAAPEGHILIMTTNAPDDLDETLVRAGRVSVKAEFTLASREQARQMFVSMFPAEYIQRKGRQGSDRAVLGSESRLGSVTAAEETALDIATLAERFVAEIKDRDLSPAELQDFLVSHKEDPLAAVDGIHDFVEMKRRERAEKEAKKERHKAEKKERAAIRRKAYEEKNSRQDRGHHERDRSNEKRRSEKLDGNGDGDAGDGDCDGDDHAEGSLSRQHVRLDD